MTGFQIVEVSSAGLCAPCKLRHVLQFYSLVLTDPSSTAIVRWVFRTELLVLGAVTLMAACLRPKVLTSKLRPETPNKPTADSEPAVHESWTAPGPGEEMLLPVDMRGVEKALARVEASLQTEQLQLSCSWSFKMLILFCTLAVQALSIKTPSTSALSRHLRTKQLIAPHPFVRSMKASMNSFRSPQPQIPCRRRPGFVTVHNP